MTRRKPEKLAQHLLFIAFLRITPQQGSFSKEQMYFFNVFVQILKSISSDYAATKLRNAKFSSSESDYFSGFSVNIRCLDLVELSPPRSCFVSQHSNINTFTATAILTKYSSRWNLNFMLPSLTGSNHTLSLFQVCKRKYQKYWPAKNTPQKWGNRVESYI